PRWWLTRRSSALPSALPSRMRRPKDALSRASRLITVVSISFPENHILKTRKRQTDIRFIEVKGRWLKAYCESRCHARRRRLQAKGRRNKVRAPRTGLER